MHALELPHSANCLVCGRSNPHGLKLRLRVITDTGLVSTEFVPRIEHTGFENTVHGGLLATVLDEAMTWAATWKNKRFCYCGELTTRFRYPVRPGDALRIEALVEFSRPKLVEVASKVFDFTGRLAATGSGKYVPLTLDEHLGFMRQFIDDAQTAEATRILRGLPPAATPAPAPSVSVSVFVPPTPIPAKAPEPEQRKPDADADADAHADAEPEHEPAPAPAPAKGDEWSTESSPASIPDDGSPSNRSENS
jgi:acyl-coenzyme A thioesterase PaaI-like protein